MHFFVTRFHTDWNALPATMPISAGNASLNALSPSVSGSRMRCSRRSVILLFTLSIRCTVSFVVLSRFASFSFVSRVCADCTGFAVAMDRSGAVFNFLAMCTSVEHARAVRARDIRACARVRPGNTVK